MADSDRKRPWRCCNRPTRSPTSGCGLRTLPTGPVIEHPDWVDVIALTADLNIVLVDQYRHSVRSVRTEFPAGTVDDGEEPLAAIQRELLEETGYASDEWHLLGTAPVYPPLQTNRIYSFLALNARRIGGQALDDGEVIHAYELPFTAIHRQGAVGSDRAPRASARRPVVAAGPAHRAWRPRNFNTFPLSDSSSRGSPARTWLQKGLMLAPT